MHLVLDTQVEVSLLSQSVCIVRMLLDNLSGILYVKVGERLAEEVRTDFLSSCCLEWSRLKCRRVSDHGMHHAGFPASCVLVPCMCNLSTRQSVRDEVCCKEVS